MAEDLFADEFPAAVLEKALDEQLGQDYWPEAVMALAEYVPPAPSLTLAHADRKWEVVSAYQKSVRRGDKELALRLVSAMCSLPAELPYFWRRICTTACEDVGPGDNRTMNFVIVCSTVFTPKKAAQYQYKIMCFLTDMMCETTRSRIYCSMSIIENLVKGKVTPLLSDDYKQIVNAIMDCGKEGEWSTKNNWRGEGMLKFQQFDLPQAEMKQAHGDMPLSAMIKGLPEYAYDMHTRVGQSVLIRMTGFKIIKDFFAAHPTLEPKNRALGWALFFEEGGVIAGEHYWPDLLALEQKFVAAKFGYDIVVWLALRDLVKSLLDDGAIRKLREKVAAEQPY